MIICKLQGGLGNQMFQYAAAKSYSEKYETELYFDTNFFNTQSLRRLQLNTFENIQLNIASSNMYSRFTKDMNTSGYKPFSVNNVRDTFSYDIDSKEFIRYHDGLPFDLLFIDGYWQSEKYFKDYQHIIKKSFYLNPNIDTSFVSDNSVSLHVRRSDYVTSNGYHPIQDIDYYMNALDIISDYDQILVFSDDINWCKDNLKFDKIYFVENFSDIDDMYIMGLCKNNIIANSSFSWWGAWLNSSPNKKVIAPSKWFGDKANINQSDIIPPDWIKI